MKKVLRSTGLARTETEAVRFMEEVAAMGRGGLTRRELIKLGLATGAGGLVGGKPRLSLADSIANVSPPCLNPWTDPLYIPPVVQPFDRYYGMDVNINGCPAPIGTGATAGRGFNIADAPNYTCSGDISTDLRVRVSDPTGQSVTYWDARTEAHQRWDESWPSAGAGLGPGLPCPFTPDKNGQYLLLARCVPFSFYPKSDGAQGHCHPWIYVDGSDPLCYDPDPVSAGMRAGQTPRLGPLRMVARYGQPGLVRLVNMLPNENYGFGMNKITMHLHNAHNAPVSDGGPLRWFNGLDDDQTPRNGQFWDYHYPNVRAGFSSTHKTTTYIDGQGKSWTCAGNFAETLSTLWFHDHKMDFTAQNVYKGLASFYILYSNDINLDCGGLKPDGSPADESQGLGLPCGPNFEYDVPLVFADKMFNPSSGEMFMDILNFEGWLGDCQTVNYQIKPFLQVKPRKYRFRLLVGGPSRFFQFFLSVERKDGSKTDIKLPFSRISSDGNLLENPINQQTFRMGVAERVDVIINFANLIDVAGKRVNLGAGDVLWLENRLEQTNGRGPTGKVLAPSLPKDAFNKNNGTNLLKFVFKPMETGEIDRSVIPTPTRARPTSMLVLPALPVQLAAKRSWDFGTSNGAWTVNGRLFDPNVISAQIKVNTCEEWTCTAGNGWAHPLHIHHEEFRITSRDGKAPPAEEVARKDVFRIGAAAIIDPNSSTNSQNSGRVVFQMQFRDWLGDYPMHCHNVVHEDHAMMIRWKIVP